MNTACQLPCRVVVKDTDCVALLQWALPHLGLRWRGFRRVRGQVCKRIERRIRELGLSGRDVYIGYLGDHSSEWAVLDACCRISISRFCRDRAVFDCLTETVLPELAATAAGGVEPVIRCWSAGCASGEEPYTLSLIWQQRVRFRFPGTNLTIVATDADERLLTRARMACYQKSSLKELPPEWVERAFERRGRLFCLRHQWKAGIEFTRQDIRVTQPSGSFELVLYRNLAFTYFDEPSQRLVLAGIAKRLCAHGFLVLGRHESLPTGVPFVPLAGSSCIYHRAS